MEEKTKKNPHTFAGCGFYRTSTKVDGIYMVPEVGIEPTRAQGPLDFESSASTSFTTPAEVLLLIPQKPFYCQEN